MFQIYRNSSTNGPLPQALRVLALGRSIALPRTLKPSTKEISPSSALRTKHICRPPLPPPLPPTPLAHRHSHRGAHITPTSHVNRCRLNVARYRVAPGPSTGSQFEPPPSNSAACSRQGKNLLYVGSIGIFAHHTVRPRIRSWSLSGRARGKR